MNEHDIASASLSRVDCTVCGGRLYTDHKPDCPVLRETERRHKEFAEMMAREYRRAFVRDTAGNP